MSFLQTIAPGQATGETAALYAACAGANGAVPNWAQAFCHRPEILLKWQALLGEVKKNIAPRRYELATIAAAKALRNSYCVLAHGSVLAREHCSAGDLAKIVASPNAAPLSDQEKAIMRYAAKVATDAASVTPTDIAELRALGLSDTEVFDVATAVGVRCFFAKVLDAVGALPDAAFNDLDAGLRETLVVGRPIAGSNAA